MIPMGMSATPKHSKYLETLTTHTRKAFWPNWVSTPGNKLQIELWYESSGHYQASGDLAALIKAQLEGSGVISVTLKGADWPSYRLNRNDGIMQAFVYGWYPDYVDPDDYAFSVLGILAGSTISSNMANTIVKW